MEGTKPKGKKTEQASGAANCVVALEGLVERESRATENEGIAMANLSGSSGRDGRSDARLDRLFLGFRDSAVVPEASANFSANMWQAIEARRSNRVFGLWAKLVTSGALAASLLFGVLSSAPQKTVEPEYLAVYIEHTTPAPEPAEMLSTILDSDDR
jgi:hypothetical protein